MKKKRENENENERKEENQEKKVHFHFQRNKVMKKYYFVYVLKINNKFEKVDLLQNQLRLHIDNCFLLQFGRVSKRDEKDEQNKEKKGEEMKKKRKEKKATSWPLLTIVFFCNSNEYLERDIRRDRKVNKIKGKEGKQLVDATHDNCFLLQSGKKEGKRKKYIFLHFSSSFLMS